ncbi:uncharacterized protein LOC123540501 [Mercenaria mercenaria]|uniref:uncharacterized protein LOC123540501 n=1 Tax=Mercenaria mercenaria TaxID=6596 RepID=UPI00234EA52A|nr:uncharacterized protein LOC123540501 [Mercenaria mercenaria]XP_045181518.2 uncharacterized protein LOC123540501 [Mercenaria mercenaria]XP_053382723.1 uncharacterized protein LOC123540501 [Mercenaria mercenaria]
MVLSLERAVSLIDLRRTQRRVAALMLNDKHVELQKYPLRKRTLPQRVCYVCSRIDPNGLFRNPDDHLYRKGFFNSCDHLHNAPHTVIVHDEHTKQDSYGEDSLTELAKKRTEKISVTIRRGSKSTKLPSSMKQEEIYESDISKITYEHRSPGDNLLVREVSDSSGRKFSLPPIVPKRSSRLSDRSSRQTVTYSKIMRTPSTVLSRKSPFLSETLPVGSETETVSIGERITVIPTGFDRTSAISGLSTFSEGTTPSKSTNDLDSKFASEEGKSLPIRHSVTTRTSQRSINTPIVDKNSVTTFPSKQTHTTKSKKTLSTSESSTLIDMFLNQSDDLQDGYRPAPPVKEEVMIGENREPVSRPKAGHQRERILQGRHQVTSKQSGSTKVSESGYGLNDDLLTDLGSENPQTQSEHDMEKEMGKTQIGSLSDSCSSNGISDASIIFSEQTAESRYPTEKHELCRCSTAQREKSFSRNLCKACGKKYQLESSMWRDMGSQQIHTQTGTGNDTRASSSTRCLSTRQQMLQHEEAKVKTSVRSKTTTDEDRLTRMYIRSKTSIDEEHLSGMYIRSKTTTEDDYMTRMHMRSKQSPDKDFMGRINLRSKQTIDEDYMDMDNIIYDDDGRYWSSGEESPSPTPMYRHQHAHPYPLVNPDIHKIVYIQALQAAQARNIKDIEDFDEMLRRPNVFSYIPLLPDKNQEDAKHIGLRPDDSTTPKKGQLMKHIFGNFRPDDYYKGNKTEVIFDYTSNDSSTEKLTSGETPIPTN